VTQPHACPDCQCEPVCELCHGLGFVVESWSVDSWDRGDGVIYGSGGTSTAQCPNGCPQPQLYYPVAKRPSIQMQPRITDARAHSARTHDL
jgi:hypothetical protein